MGTLPGGLNLDELDSRFQNAIRDSTISEADRYTYIKDAYSRIWHKNPWEFRKATATLSVSAGVSEYALDDQCDLVVAAFNETNDVPLIMNESFFQYWDEYHTLGISGSPTKVADVRSENGNTTLVFQETPTADAGHGDTITYYYFKHLTHENDGGTVVTGNVSLSTDVPTLAPQFHQILVKEATLEALKNKRQFGEVYQATLLERNEMLKAMEKRYLTPRRYPGRVRTYR